MIRHSFLCPRCLAIPHSQIRASTHPEVCQACISCRADFRISYPFYLWPHGKAGSEGVQVFSIFIPPCGEIEYSSPWTGHAKSNFTFLLRGCAVPPVIDATNLSDFLRCFADPFPYGYRSNYHHSTTSMGMFMDTARSPELSNISFIPFSWQDTGKADAVLQFAAASVTVFSFQRRDRPFQLGLAVLYSIRFRCCLGFCG